MFARLGGDPYRTLGVCKKSTSSEIRWQYYRLCRELHPDTQRLDSKARPAAATVGDQTWQQLDDEGRRKHLCERFAAVIGAYEVLSDAGLRQQYDAYIERKHYRRTASFGGDKSSGWRDPWASERPAPANPGRQKTREERLADRQLTVGVFGLLGGMMLVSWFKRQTQQEDELRLAEMRHTLSTEALESAHRQAVEKWREAPPGHVMEYEAKRLAPPPKPGVTKADELRELWPNGVGLGLLPLLDDSQLCGVRARASVAEDPEIARQRAATRRALASDKVISRYIALSSEENN
ncbi:DnaJ sub A member 3, mitochondrial [Coemansia aciculifera]|nr:DnaJ sub A member 3, mitochondrial [Coemansia aciculifera]